MNKRRLLKLADLLEADAKNKEGVKFDLFAWGTVENEKELVSCGTHACAVGLAAVSGAFKRQGLGFRLGRVNDFGRRNINITLNGKCRGTPNFDGSFVSAMKFFDLNYAEASWLFIASRYGDLPTKASQGERAVAKRLRYFVAGKQIPAILANLRICPCIGR